jgi:DNA-binding NarL/FixJ family response regulator
VTTPIASWSAREYPCRPSWQGGSISPPKRRRSDWSSAIEAPTSIRVILADGDNAAHDELRRELAADGRLEVVGNATDGVELSALLAAIDCDAVLLGLDLPPRGGLQVLADSAGQQNVPATLVLSRHDDAAHVDRALALGAHGYVMKNAPITEIIGAVAHAVAGGVYIQPAIARAVVQRHLLLVGPPKRVSDDLSRRQLELLRALAIGMTNKEIAHLLELTQGTVNDYMKDLFIRLGVASRAAAVSTGMRRGLIA